MTYNYGKTNHGSQSTITYSEVSLINRFLMIFISFLLIFLMGSIKEDYIHYELGLPKKMNEGMRKALYKYVFYYNEVPRPGNSEPIFSTFYISSTEMPDEMYFFELPESVFKEEYKSLNEPRDGYFELEAMKRNTEEHFSQVHPHDVDLPWIELKDNRFLVIRKPKDDITVDLKEMGMENLEIGKFFITILENTEEDMLIHLTSFNFSEGEGLLVFLKSDLSKSFTVKDGKEAIEKAYESGELDSYSSIFKSIGSTGKYETLSNKEGILSDEPNAYLFDRNKKEKIHIDPKDVLSHDGQYVVIDGENLKKGTQYIQRTEDYLAGHEGQIIEVEIDDHIIAKLLEFKKPAKLHDLDLIFFNENFMIYRLQYHLDGDRTEITSVLVDLNQDNPVPYLYEFW